MKVLTDTSKINKTIKLDLQVFVSPEGEFKNDILEEHTYCEACEGEDFVVVRLTNYDKKKEGTTHTIIGCRQCGELYQWKEGSSQVLSDIQYF